MCERLEMLHKVLDPLLHYTPDDPLRLNVLLDMPEVKAVVDVPPDVVLTEDSFDVIIQALPNFVSEYKATARKYFAGLVQQNIDDIDPHMDPLSLAVGTVFVCNRCRRSHSYPNIASHTCRPRTLSWLDEDDVFRQAAIRTANLGGYEKSYWEPIDFRADVKEMEWLVRMHGLVPKTATIQDMEGSSIRLTCPRVNESNTRHMGHSRVMTAMNWLSMVSWFYNM